MRLMTWPALSARSSPRVLLDGESLVAAAADLVVVVQAASNVSMAAPGAKEGAWHRGVEAAAVAG